MDGWIQGAQPIYVPAVSLLDVSNVFPLTLMVRLAVCGGSSDCYDLVTVESTIGSDTLKAGIFSSLDGSQQSQLGKSEAGKETAQQKLKAPIVHHQQNKEANAKASAGQNRMQGIIPIISAIRH
jgi:hypothetical protein